MSELRLATATTLEDANVVLEGYLPRHNARFGVPAADPAPAWRPLPAGLTAAAVFCFHYPRRVANDATVSWPGGPLALPRRHDGRSWAGRTVTLQERLDGSLWVNHEGELYPLRPAPPDPGQLRARRLAAPAGSDLPAEVAELAEAETSPAPDPSAGVPWRPAPDHPWRRYRSRER